MTMILERSVPPVVVVTAGEWTPDLVHARFVEAFDTMRSLPSPRPRGYQSSMPEPVRTAEDVWFRGGHDGDPMGLYAEAPTRLSPGNLGKQRIDRMDEAFRWFDFLSHKDRLAMRIVISGRALHRPMRDIRKALKRAGYHSDNGEPPSRWSVNRWQRKGLGKIARVLNG